jgi:predicted nuclease of predicted toxin-antitoxin system
MRFKLDENLDHRLIRLFVAHGHDVETVRGEGLSGRPDQEIYEVAVAEHRTLVTLDLDFANPLRFPAAGTRGVVVLRVHRPTLSAVEQTLQKAMARFTEQALENRLWIVEPGRIREYSPEDPDR